MPLKLGTFVSSQVSIPNRDFVELQCEFGKLLWEITKVSIPNRDFVELQFLELNYPQLSIYKFQSLIGILLNCNSGSRKLIGILLNCNSGSRKAKLYLVFKVRLRDSRAIIALQDYFGKSVGDV